MLTTHFELTGHRTNIGVFRRSHFLFVVSTLERPHKRQGCASHTAGLLAIQIRVSDRALPFKI